MAADRNWTVWLGVAGSLASLTALGYIWGIFGDDGKKQHPAFAGLPKTGRIPMDTARRALARLPKKSRECAGMTAASLREGMEIEREHRDVTRGTVGRTAKIAAAHICESGTGYYKGLKKLEHRLKAKR